MTLDILAIAAHPDDVELTCGATLALLVKQGYRVGILANSDGHKGRHGASHPGASLFGAYGGLSCLLARELTRAGLFEALRRRRTHSRDGFWGSERFVVHVRTALPE